MRLTCPNCTAQYEVEDSVIPVAGRDVQCSACGHIWFQYPAEVALAMRAAELEEDEDDAPPVEAEQGGTQIDRKVLDVLREEAKRELEARRGSGLETQGDLGLVARPERTRPERARSDRSNPALEETSQSARGPASRRNLLPDIEELSTTLEPGREPRKRGEVETTLPPTTGEARRGFLQGFGLVAMIMAALALLYVFAGPLANAAPFLTESLRGYVAMVDSLRDATAGTLRGLLGRE